jgi:hypothetical protein
MMMMTVENRSGHVDHILGNAVGRLELLIDQETASLRHATVSDLREFNNRKAQVLVELDRVVSANLGQPPSPAMKERLGALRDKLAVNRKTLKLHLDAVQEVASMLSDQIRDAESDGTYTNGIRKGKDRP